MADGKQGNPTKPQGPALPGGSAAPVRAPGTAPGGTPKGATVDTTGTPNFLATGASVSSILNNDGYVGVDPIYQNSASHVESPNAPEEPEEG